MVVHAANTQGCDGAQLVLAKLKGGFPRLVLLWADGGYAGQWIGWVASCAGWGLQIVKRPEEAQGFVVLPKRWIVERTLAWLGKYRRLSKDYEYLTDSSEAMIRWAMIHIMVRRLA